MAAQGFGHQDYNQYGVQGASLPGYSPPPPLPGVHFSPAELEYYQQLFAHADPDRKGYIEGQASAQFLMLSGLPQETLSRIWELADSNSQGFLTSEGFSVACRLVAWAQAQGATPAPEQAQLEPPLLPDFPGLPRKAPSEQSHGSRAPSIGCNSEQSELQPVIGAKEPSSKAPSRPRSLSPLRTFTPDRWAPSQREKRKYASLFKRTDWNGDGLVEGQEAFELLERSRLDNSLLSVAWGHSDFNQDGKLDFKEFLCLVHLVTCVRRGAQLPGPQEALPPQLVNSLAKLEPLEVLAAEREASRSRSASPHPSAPTTPVPPSRDFPGTAAAWSFEETFPGAASPDAAGAFDAPNDAFGAFPETSKSDFPQEWGQGDDAFGAFKEKDKEKKKEKKEKKKKGKDRDEDGNDGGGLGTWGASTLGDWQDPVDTALGEGKATLHSQSDFVDPFATNFPLENSDRGRSPSMSYRDPRTEGGVSREITAISAMDKDLSTRLLQEVSKLDKDLRKVEEGDLLLERQVAEDISECDRLKGQKHELELQREEVRERLLVLRTERHGVSLESLSLRRDRGHLQEEVAFLRRAAEEEEETLKVLRATNRYLETSAKDLEAGVQLLEERRKELLELITREREEHMADERRSTQLRSSLEQLRSQSHQAPQKLALPLESPGATSFLDK
eukprot:TRINITY_DN16089_c0_g1_i1.p1 TRINITY_DN16089_c0_g1~~TRINITY_DN16089_c0_g1_i1.p1  ORF type:complete len:673 (-),score=158.34 TRINITY_DN16089_c0_g1_i1:10-2028(-)